MDWTSSIFGLLDQLIFIPIPGGPSKILLEKSILHVRLTDRSDGRILVMPSIQAATSTRPAGNLTINFWPLIICLLITTVLHLVRC